MKIKTPPGYPPLPREVGKDNFSKWTTAVELTNIYIEDAAERLLSAGAHGCVFGAIEFARAIIEADRALRASPAVGEVAMPVADSEDPLMASIRQHTDTRRKLSDAQAALAAKDAEIAQLKSDLARPESIEVGMMRAEIAKMWTKEQVQRMTAGAVEACEITHRQERATLTAERVELNRQLSSMFKGVTIKIPTDTMEQEFQKHYKQGKESQSKVVAALTKDRDALRVHVRAAWFTGVDDFRRLYDKALLAHLGIKTFQDLYRKEKNT